MLKNLGRASVMLRLGKRVCVCLPNSRLSAGLRAKIRPLVVAGLACWCDKAPAD